MLTRVRWDKLGTRLDQKVVYPLIDRCREGHGVWLDDGELEWLLELGETALPERARSRNSPPTPSPEKTPYPKDPLQPTTSSGGTTADALDLATSPWTSSPDLGELLGSVGIGFGGDGGGDGGDGGGGGGGGD
jgi:Zn-finger nucleic acid-binding protein